MAKFLFCRRSDSIDVIDVSVIIRQAYKRNSAAIELQRRFLNLAPQVRKRMMMFVAMNLTGRKKRGKLLRKGLPVPRNIFLSPTYRCNLDCRHCYAKGRSGELPLEIINKVVDEQEQLGICNVFVTGGEPFLRDDLWQIYERYPKTLFCVFTNGTMVQEKDVANIARLGNIRLIVSLEGFSQQTDSRRGKGVYDQAVRVLELCHKANILYGVSVMVSSQNYEEITSWEFVEELVRRGVYFVVLPLYMPFGPDAEKSLMISRDRLEALEQWAENVKKTYPIFPAVARNGSDKVTACSAASHRLHVAADGNIEPCFFCQWAAENIKERSILEAMNSDFFRAVRGFNKSGETCLNSCKAHQSVFLQRAFEMTGARPTNGKEVKEWLMIR